MRGDDAVYGKLFSDIDLEKRVSSDHPLWTIRGIANAALKSLSSEFARLYSPIGRLSIPPERLRGGHGRFRPHSPGIPRSGSAPGSGE
jgi:hypothetical protein